MIFCLYFCSYCIIGRYNDGDDNMKKIIGEAMLKSQRGEKPDMPDIGGDMPKF